ncbi:carboxylate--amine ligase [Taklimakanibacter deserti]|uniref:carboxylate--amine ligase n=1 Tax=Taklimakanibacter deserti TaxID=2267839 RepID=UPI000E64B258
MTTADTSSVPAATASAPRGAIILAGSHGAIALARVLARQKLDVWFLTNHTPLPRFSRAVAHWRNWSGPEKPGAVDQLEDIVRREKLEGYLLIPAADGDVKFVAQAHARLSRHLNVLLPDWSSLQWAGDKAQTYRRAAELGLAFPEVYPVRSLADAATMPMRFPVALKPSMRIALNRFTRDKVWRADNREDFVRLYAEAASLVGPDCVVVQELVPGDGECQLSYAGLWWQGRPVSSFTAQRTRQYPIDFSYTSTFVETIESEDVHQAAETFLSSIGHHGLCEIEFKRDPRNGALKILDVNPRPWSWFGLADAAGIDFGAAIVALASGHKPPPMRARAGVGWMFGQRDPVAAFQLALAGRLDVGRWLASLTRTRTFASLSLSDPLPSLIELPITVARVLARNFGKSRHNS